MPKFKSVEEAIDVHRNYHVYSPGRKKHFTEGTEFFSMHRMRIGWLVNQINDGDMLLDIGCSGGEFIEYIKSHKDITACGVDVNASAIEYAKSNGIDAKISTAEELPFEDNTFDVCLMSEILEHLYDPIVAIKEACRVLKPSGKIIGSVPHIDSFILKNKPYDKYEFHARDYTPHLLRCHLEQVFNRVEIITVLVNLIDVGQSPFWMVFKGDK